MKGSDRFVINGAACLLRGERLPVANLSIGGLFVATDRPFLPGQVVSFQLALPEREPLRASGHVTWVNAPSGDAHGPAPPGFGVRITQMAFVDKLALVSFLRQAELQDTRIRGAEP